MLNDLTIHVLGFWFDTRLGGALDADDWKMDSLTLEFYTRAPDFSRDIQEWWLHLFHMRLDRGDFVFMPIQELPEGML